MKFKELYALAIKLGIEADPRGKKEVERELKERNEKYKKMDKKEKAYFDKDSLTNPYFDSRILHANSLNDNIKTIMAGIDLEHTEIQLAHELKEMGRKIDLVLAHHPEGQSLLGLSEDMHLQVSVMEHEGVPVNLTEKILSPRVTEVERGLHPANFIRCLHTAQLLKINYANTHTITDNMVYQYMKKNICEKSYRTIGDLIDRLMKEPEYQMASKLNNPPMIFVGSKKALAGKVAATGFTGGTGGHEDIYEKLSHAGVGTILTMHMSEKSRKMAEKYHMNVVVAGHMASDSLGMNLLLDEFEKKGVKIIPCGMFRVSRDKKKK